MSELRDAVRQRYSAAATSVKRGMAADDVTEAACCEPSEGYGLKFYDITERETLPDDAVLASLGCGNPTAVADLHEGETVLDLGSGGGIDVLLSAQRVGPTGFAYGLDMTGEMLELARKNARKAGARNVEFLEGFIEEISARCSGPFGPAGGSGSVTSSPTTSSRPRSEPSAGATSAASPARFRWGSTSTSCAPPASPRSRSSRRTRPPTRCTARSSRP
jgi:hypothetical protein